MRKEETGSTVNIPTLTVEDMVELDSARQPNENPKGYDPYNKEPGADNPPSKDEE